jgi:hypothetical protein
MASSDAFARNVRLAREAEEKIRVAKESSSDMETKGINVRGTSTMDVVSDADIVDFDSRIQGDYVANVLEIAGIMHTRRAESQVLSSFNLMNEQGEVDQNAMKGLSWHLDQIDKANSVPTAQGIIVPVMTCHDDAQFNKLNGILGGRVVVIKQNDLSRGVIMEIMRSKLESRGQDINSYETHIRGIVGRNDPLTDAFSSIVDSLIVSDASFRAVLMIYADHVAKNKSAFTLFTDRGVSVLQSDVKLRANANKAMSRGMSVEVVDSKDTLEEVDRALEASFESDVAF